MNIGLTWDNIYLSWKDACEEWCPKIFTNEIFKDVFISHKDDISPNYQIGYDIIDWWPNQSIESRINRLTTNGRLGVNWAISPGIMKTANMLWDNKEELERMAMIWICASLVQLDKHFPRDWDSNSYILITTINKIVLQEMYNLGIGVWHGSTKRTLPESLIYNINIFKSLNNVDEVMHFIALENTICVTNWTLVKVSKQD